MSLITGVCGLDCSTCEAYLATQAEDEVEKERVAQEWREIYHNPNVDVAYVTCDSCLATSGRVGGHCKECTLRLCAIERGLNSCAYCMDYVTCPELKAFFGFVPAVKITLDEMRNA